MRRPARRKPTWVRALKTTSYLAFCGLALAGGTLAGWINQSPFVREILVQRVQHKNPEDIWGGSGDVTLLILGCDEDRYYGGKQILKDRALMQNPSKLPKVAEKARDVMGGALSDQEVASLVLFAKAVGGENIKMGMVPTVPARNFNLRVDSSKLDETLREYKLLEGKRVAVRQP